MSLPDLDTSLFFFINRELRNPFFDVLMPFITSHPFLVFSPFLLLLVLKEKTNSLPALAAGLFAVALADATGHILKDLVMRQRPCTVLDNVHLLVGCGNSYSMPSNHAFNAFAFSMSLWLMRRSRAALLCIVPAALIALSRISVGVHYPSDVLAGAMLGVGTSYAVLIMYRHGGTLVARNSYARGLVLLLLLLSFFRLFFIATGPFDLSPDEAHYWEWSRRLDWSYYSKGPAIAWLIRAGTSVFGNTVPGVRVLAVVLSALSSFLVFLLGRDLYGEKAGFAAALLFQIVPLFSIFGILLTIDSPFIFFWMLSLVIFWRIIRGSGQASPAVWALLGISVGMGLLTKYTMAFFPFCAFLFMLFRRDSRGLLKTTGPYLAFLISMFVFSPVLFWNAAHGWVTLKHTAGQAHLHEGAVLSLRTCGEFFASQAGVVTPLLFVMLFLALRKLRGAREGALLFWFSVPVIIFFTLKSLQGKVQANWALTGYLAPLIAFSAVYIAGWKDLGRLARLATAAAIVLALAVSLAAHVPSALGLPDRLDPSLRLVGWKELGREASAAYQDLSAEGPAFVFSDSYQVAGELAFYMEGNPVTYCANTGRRMNQYDLWPGFENLKGQNALFVRAKEKGLPDEIGAAFDYCRRRVISVTARNRRIVKFTFFTCYDFNGFNYRAYESY